MANAVPDKAPQQQGVGQGILSTWRYLPQPPKPPPGTTLHAVSGPTVAVTHPLDEAQACGLNAALSGRLVLAIVCALLGALPLWAWVLRARRRRRRRRSRFNA